METGVLGQQYMQKLYLGITVVSKENSYKLDLIIQESARGDEETDERKVRKITGTDTASYDGWLEISQDKFHNGYQ